MVLIRIMYRLLLSYRTIKFVLCCWPNCECILSAQAFRILSFLIPPIDSLSSSFNTAHLKLNQKSFGSRANLFCVIIEFVQFELHHHSSTYPNSEFHKARDTERSIPYPNGRSSEHLFRLRLTSDGSLPNNDHRLRTRSSVNSYGYHIMHFFRGKSFEL